MRLGPIDISLARDRERRGVVEPGTGVSWLRNLIELWSGGRSAAGIAVSEAGALGIGAVYTAVRVLSGTIASLPLHTYRRLPDGGRELALSHWAYSLLHDSPNSFHTSFIWREIMLAHVLLWGNSYNRIEWMANGAASELLPLMPWNVRPQFNKSGTEKVYEVILPEGRETLPDDEVLHVPGLCFDGLAGISVVRAQRDALGTAKALEQFTGAFFANGAKPGAILEVPARMDAAAQKNLAESIKAKFADPADAFKVLVLEEGSKLLTYTMPLDDAQHLELKRYSRQEIFGWFGIPPHLSSDTERQTSWGTGIEQMDIGYAKHVVTPWLIRIEQELNRKLFIARAGLFVKFNLDALLRGDFKTRMEGLTQAVGGPFLKASEARELEDWPAEEGADQLLRPLNMGVVGAPTGAGSTTGQDEANGRNALAAATELRMAPDPIGGGASAGRADTPQNEDDMGKPAITVNIGAPPPMPAPQVHVTTPLSIGREFDVLQSQAGARMEQHEERIAALFGDLARQMSETLAAALQQMEVSREDAGRAAREFSERLAAEMRAGMEGVAREIGRPRRTVLDDDGNVIGSVPVDELPG